MRSTRAAHSSTLVVLLAVLALVATACDAAPGPTAQPSAAGPATPAPTVPASESPGPSASTEPSAPPSVAPSPDAQLEGLTAGVVAVTVTDGLRVRSEPRVAADSLKYTPLLAKGTQLVVTAGPVVASRYTWFRVAPIGATLNGGVDQGWVAVADHDGTPWVALADDPTPGFELAAVDVDPIDPSLAAARAQAKAVNSFGIALYRRLRTDPELKSAGIVFSPYSIETALAMARAGAKGTTATEMDTVLRVSGWGPLGTGMASLATVLARRDGSWVVQGDGEKGTHFLALRTANMAFAQEGYALEAAYLSRISRTFRSGLGLVDYIADAGAARDAINGWVSRQTLGRIPKLLGDSDVTEATRLVLVNAVYFKGEWQVPFYEGNTQPARFTTADGTEVRAPMMETRGGQDIPYARGDGWRATELRYLGPDARTPLAMTIVLPDDLAAFEKGLSSGRLAGITSALATQRSRQQVVSDGVGEDACQSYPYETHLFMPKFGIETSAKLNEQLKAMGMPTAFQDGAADFSGMTREDPLHIGFVIHQANIDVDELGTEAAAATAVGMDTGGCTGPMPLAEKTLRLNRPFVFFIRDLQTGAILFMGRVMDPTVR